MSEATLFGIIAQAAAQRAPGGLRIRLERAERAVAVLFEGGLGIRFDLDMRGDEDAIRTLVVIEIDSLFRKGKPSYWSGEPPP